MPYLGLRLHRPKLLLVRGVERGDRLLHVAGRAIVSDIPIERIDPGPFQIRQTLDEDRLRELASSMQHVGLLQPIFVRPKGERFEIVASKPPQAALTIPHGSDHPQRSESAPAE